MTINFTNYPTTNRVPGVYAEVDASKANTGNVLQNALIIGQQAATGTFVPNVPVLSLGVTDAANKAGAGSQLALMLARYRQHDPYSPVWLLPLADAGGSTKAVGSFAFAGTATAAGSLPVYVGDGNTRAVGDTIVNVAVAIGDTATVVAGNVKTALLAQTSLPMVATIATSTVTLTAVNGGLCGNDIMLSLAPLGAAGGQSIPAGITCTITQPTGGATNPTLTTALGNLGQQTYDFIANPYNDTTSLAAFTQFMSFTTGRWSPLQALYGHVYSAFRGTYGTAYTFLDALNDPHLTVMPFGPSSLTPYWLWAAALAGAAGQALQGDNCVVPFRQVPLYVSAPAQADLYTPWPQQNSLLYVGGSTFIVTQSGQVQPQKVITTYQLNAAGVADNSYLNVERLYTLMQVLRLRTAFLWSQFGRKALVSNSTQIPQGSNRVNAATIQGSVVAYQYYLQDTRGLVQNAATFAGNVQVNNMGNGLVTVLAPDDLTNQLDIIAILVQFVAS
jgi:phage tail sheath gpL-like